MVWFGSSSTKSLVDLLLKKRHRCAATLLMLRWGKTQAGADAAGFGKASRSMLSTFQTLSGLVARTTTIAVP